ncbi:MAG: hypothetical protein RR461_11740 [Angelakisella sp.]
MRKKKMKKGIVATCVLVPAAAALAFVPKIFTAYKVRKYTSASF